MKETQVTTLKEAGKFLVNADVVDLETMQVEGKQLLEVCGYSYGTSPKKVLDRQIAKHCFIEGKDFQTSMPESSTGRPKTVYHFTFNASQHVLLASFTEQGKQARQEAINLKEETNTPALSGDTLLDMMTVLTIQRKDHLSLVAKVDEQAHQLEEQAVKLETIQESTVILPNRPQNAESISTIRTRINKRYGLPQGVVDEVLNTFTYAPRPAGQVKNAHKDSGGNTYTVWNIAEVNRLFERFVRECECYSKTKSTHNLIEKPFKLK